MPISNEHAIRIAVEHLISRLGAADVREGWPDHDRICRRNRERATARHRIRVPWVSHSQNNPLAFEAWLVPILPSTVETVEKHGDQNAGQSARTV